MKKDVRILPNEENNEWKMMDMICKAVTFRAMGEMLEKASNFISKS